MLSVRSEAPDFELKDPGGTVHRLDDALRTGPVVLVFYKSECPTCEFTLPFIQKVFAGTGNPSACRIWAVSQDETAETKRFAERLGLEFEFLIDEHPYQVSSAYGVEFVPSIFVVERSRLIGYNDYGFSKAALNVVSRRIADCAGRPPVTLFWPGDGLPETRPG